MRKFVLCFVFLVTIGLSYGQSYMKNYVAVFDGNNYATVNQTSSSCEVPQLTVSMWVKPTSTTDGNCIFAMRNTNGLNRFSLHLMMLSKRIDIWTGSTSGVRTLSYPFEVGIWYYFAFVMTEYHTDIYINGTKVGSYDQGTLTSGNVRGTGVGIGGIVGGAEMFRGLMDEVSIFNRPLSLQEIQTNMQYPGSNNSNGLLALFNFDYFETVNPIPWISGFDGQGGQPILSFSTPTKGVQDVLGGAYFPDKVGIGTSNPQATLHVVGTVAVGDTWNNTSLQLFSSGGESYLQSGGGVNFVNTFGDYQMGISDDGNVVIPNGKVGIGNTDSNGTPNFPGDRKLYVNGSILATKVEIQKVESWSDFVFAKEFKLKPLHEVEQFISENKHLPDVPSEKEVKKDGIDVAKMNATLLQKLEEAYLHLIELNKRVELLEKENAKLKK